uniref:Uncharacterized protein n=1 Tax=Glossina palpalis gambiensis TaxID=67801 RepID=A0A1B0AQT8_9MUSC
MKNYENYKMITYSAIISLIFILQSSKILATEISTSTTTTTTTTTEESNKADGLDLTNVTFSLPIAEKLIYVHHPASLKSIKHIIEPIRHKYKRPKRPKIKYSFAEPPGNHYNDHSSTYFEDFSHLNLESDDFGLPPSSYDTHVTNVKFYNEYEKPKVKYEGIQKLPSYSYGGSHESNKQVYKSPSNNYEIPEDTSSSHPTKTSPHHYPPSKQPSTDDTYQVNYNTPTERGCHDYDSKHPKKIITYAEPIYISASPSYTEKPALTYSAHNTEAARIPATKYGVPDVYFPPSTYNINSYFDHTAQNPEKPKANVQITYSQPNEIKFTSPSHYQTDYSSYDESSKTYQAPPKTYDYSPPYKAPSLSYELPNTYQTFTHGYDHAPSHNVEHSAGYQEPSGGYELSSADHMPSQDYEHPSGYETSSQNYDHSSSYQAPTQSHDQSSSYEEPSQTDVHSSLQSYDHRPPSQNYEQSSGYETSSQSYDHSASHQAPSQNHDHLSAESYDHQPPSQNYEHPHPHQESSHSHQPSHYEPPPQQSTHVAADDYIPPSNELPISRDRKHPPYDYPKSSYEVPIYDAVPFDAVNEQEHEIYPPHAPSNNNKIVTEPNNTSEEPPQTYNGGSNINNDSHSASSMTSLSASSRPRRIRKKKRGNFKSSTTTLTATTRHILDVPELENAFENEKRIILAPTDNYAHPSVRVENLHLGVWNPMKLRTSSMKATSAPSTTTTVSVSIPNTRVRNIFYRGRTTESPLSSSKSKVEIISIDKSHSKAYYDGILSTPKFTNTNVYRKLMNRHRSGSNASTMMQGSLIDAEKLFKRTTKSMLDTTPFKSPYSNDMDIKRTLPKNHKLF